MTLNVHLCVYEATRVFANTINDSKVMDVNGRGEQKEWSQRRGPISFAH